MQADRAQLPMAPYEQLIVETVRANQAVVIAAGCCCKTESGSLGYPQHNMLWHSLLCVILTSSCIVMTMEGSCCKAESESSGNPHELY
eukprot:161033-Pelagomonas_calceolata.AAC.5